MASSPVEIIFELLLLSFQMRGNGCAITTILLHAEQISKVQTRPISTWGQVRDDLDMGTSAGRFGQTDQKA